MFGEVVDRSISSLDQAADALIAGATLVVVAGILIIWRERRLGLDRERQRKSMSPQG